MELEQLKSTWQQFDAKLSKALSFNARFIETIEAQKVRSTLTPIYWQKILETTFHAAAIALLLLFLAANADDYRYALSAIVLLLFYGVAIKSSVTQLMLIGKVDLSNDIVSIQKNLALLQADNLHYARLTILCVPTFLAYPPVISEAIKDLNLSYFADFDIIAKSNGAWWTAQFFSSVFLIPVCLWMYFQLTRVNIQKPWVKRFIERSSGKRVSGALEFVNELESLKN